MVLVCNRAKLTNLTRIFARTGPPRSSEFGAFLTIAFLGLLINSTILWLLTGGEPASLLHLNLAKAAATVVSMGWNFCGYRLLFKSQLNC